MNSTNINHLIGETLLCNLERTARIARISAFRYFDENKNIDVTFNEYLILEALFSKPKIHQRDLAKLLCKGTANLSRDLEKLEKRGIIQRTLDVKGKRIVKTLELTPDGEKIYDDVNSQTYGHVMDIENIFTPEEHQRFIEYMERLKNRLTDSADMFFE